MASVQSEFPFYIGEIFKTTGSNYLVNVNNEIQIERGIYGIIIDPSEYDGNEPVEL